MEALDSAAISFATYYFTQILLKAMHVAAALPR